MSYTAHTRLTQLALLSVLTLAPLLSPLVAHASPNFELPGEPFKLAELAPRASSNEGYGEKYTFDAEVNTETGEQGTFYFSMMITNLGSGDQKMTAKGRLTVGERSWKWSFKREEGKWRSSASPLSIVAGGATLSEEAGALSFNVKRKDFTLKAKMTPLASPWQPKGGGLKLKSASARYHVLPLTTFSATLTPQEESASAVEVSGFGWGSHSASELSPYEFMRSSSKLRAIDLPHKRTLYWRTLHLTSDYGSAQRSYLIITEGERVLFEGIDINPEITKHFKDKKGYGYVVPEGFVINATHVSQPGVTLKGTIKTLKRTRRRDPVAKLGWAKRMVVKRFSKPMEYNYDVAYDLTLSGPNARSLKGEARYEMYHFNK